MRGGFARDGIAVSWLLIRRRTARSLRTAVFYRLAASLTPRLRTTISVGARSTVAIHPGPTVPVRTRTAITIRAGTAIAFTGAADLIAIAGAIRAAEIPLGGPASITPLAADIGSALRLEPGTLPDIGHHRAEALHGLLGQLFPHPGKRTGTGQGDIGLQPGDGH